MQVWLLIIAAIMWAAFATVFFFIWENRKLEAKKTKWDSIIEDAKKQADETIKEARKEAELIIKKSEKIEERIIEREEKLEEKLDLLDKKREDLITQEDNLKIEIDNLKQKEIELDGKLSEIAKLTQEEAKELFLKQIEEQYGDEALDIIKKYKKKLEDRKKDEAREIILKSIQQYAWDVTSEVTTTVIEIPSDDIKGKLIGKEGRNITTFEKETGVALIIDDTPDTVFISAFDLFKRYIAKKSLEKLIEDGRIQPARIEEVVAKTTAEADILLRELWEKIIDELWVEWLIPDELIPIVWKLRFRTSYGQNILKHSKETAIIAESIASDLWLDAKLVKVWWLLHDIWKALDQEIEWTHPEIGWKLARKYGLREEIIDMIENHHWEQFSISIEAAIVQIADAISSVRPWARREAIEQYVKRVQEMEALVASFSWVNKAYAISAGREVRVFVDADTISDLQAQNMAKDIAENIQEKLSYPWEVKVNLIREMRVIEYAK
jgi:ribonuclease Y